MATDQNSFALTMTEKALAALRPEARDRLEEALRSLDSQLESPHSKRAYREEWARWCAWLARADVEPLAARPLHVLRWLKQLLDEGKAKATRARSLTVLRQVYGALVVAELLPTNPAREVKNLHVDTAPRTPWIEEAESTKLLRRPEMNASWMEQRDWFLCATLFGLGLRRAEIARLRREQFADVGDGYTIRKVLVKRGKVGDVPVPTWLSCDLANWFAMADIFAGPIFPATKGGGKAIAPATVWSVVKRMAARAGIDPKTTPHALRRTFITLLRRRDVSLRTVAAAVLHSDEKTTQRYDQGARMPVDAPGETLRDLVPPRR